MADNPISWMILCLLIIAIVHEIGVVCDKRTPKNEQELWDKLVDIQRKRDWEDIYSETKKRW